MRDFFLHAYTYSKSISVKPMKYCSMVGCIITLFLLVITLAYTHFLSPIFWSNLDNEQRIIISRQPKTCYNSKQKEQCVMEHHTPLFDCGRFINDPVVQSFSVICIIPLLSYSVFFNLWSKAYMTLIYLHRNMELKVTSLYNDLTVTVH